MPPRIARPGSGGESRAWSRSWAPDCADTSSDPACTPPAEGRQGAGGREPGRPVTFRTARPLARPPRGPLSASRRCPAGPPCTAASPQCPPRAPRPGAAPPPAGPYLLRERDERGRHLPADSGSERRGDGGGAARAHGCGGRGAVRAQRSPGEGRAEAVLRTRNST